MIAEVAKHLDIASWTLAAEIFFILVYIFAVSRVARRSQSSTYNHMANLPTQEGDSSYEA